MNACCVVVVSSFGPFRQGTIAGLGRDRLSAWHYMRQRTIATAAAYFWRFYLKHSFFDHEPAAIAVVCVSLAGLALFARVILQPNHGSIDDTQYGPCNQSDIPRPGSDTPRRVYGQTHQLVTASMVRVTSLTTPGSDNPTPWLPKWKRTPFTTIGS